MMMKQQVSKGKSRSRHADSINDDDDGKVLMFACFKL